MPHAVKFATTLAVLAFAATALAGCTATTEPRSADSTPKASATPTRTT